MLYNLFTPYAHDFALFNLLRYITFRTGGAIMTSLLISFVTGPAIIRWLKSKQGSGQPIRSDGPETHQKKQGTPTMGGIMILISIVVSTLLWTDLDNIYVWTVLLVTLGFGAIGFADDYLKLTRKNTKGVSSRLRLFFEFGFALLAALMIGWVMKEPLNHSLAVPFFKSVLLDLGWFFVPFAMLVMVGASNAVNLTDGLDGLAIVPMMIATSCFGLIAYLVGNVRFADYLDLHYVAGTGELAIFCGALVGAGMGFLWFNAPPAMVFMGDVGSLSMGGALGAISVITKHELVLVIIGGLFVIETVSVIMQVAGFKMTGKRIFRMAPLHHHFEKKDWPETQVTVRFWILACIFALAGLSTLKLR
jgi:phospho-N-acetylmuramoyl-pentapeptide-transferase